MTLASPTQALTCQKSGQTLRRHDAGRAADCWPPRGGRGVTPPRRIHPPPLIGVTGQWAELQPRDGVQDPYFFFSPVQTGLPRERAKLLTRATQSGLESPGGGDQAQRRDGVGWTRVIPTLLQTTVSVAPATSRAKSFGGLLASSSPSVYLSFSHSLAFAHDNSANSRSRSAHLHIDHGSYLSRASVHMFSLFAHAFHSWVFFSILTPSDPCVLLGEHHARLRFS
jgi:hypothetical protein